MPPLLRREDPEAPKGPAAQDRRAGRSLQVLVITVAVAAATLSLWQLWQAHRRGALTVGLLLTCSAALLLATAAPLALTLRPPRESLPASESQMSQ